MNIGIEWRLRPDRPRQRCGAKTRRGTACQCQANKENGRCRLHGGTGTGAKTEDGLARISAANLSHGKFTKDKLEKRPENAAKGRMIRKEFRKMEREFLLTKVSLNFVLRVKFRLNTSSKMSGIYY